MTARTYSAGDLAALLASALGAAQADQVVRAALSRMKLPSPEQRAPLDEDDARRVLGDVAGQVGLVGITGRVALSRLGRSTGGSSPRELASRARRPLAVVAKLLAAAVGEERSTQAVHEAASRLSIDTSGDVDLTEALAILESLASSTGVISAAARFAKSRIHLSW